MDPKDQDDSQMQSLTPEELANDVIRQLVIIFGTLLSCYASHLYWPFTSLKVQNRLKIQVKEAFSMVQNCYWFFFCCFYSCMCQSKFDWRQCLWQGAGHWRMPIWWWGLLMSKWRERSQGMPGTIRYSFASKKVFRQVFWYQNATRTNWWEMASATMRQMSKNARLMEETVV